MVMSFEQRVHTLLAHEGCTIKGCAICEATVKICLTCGGVSTSAGGNGLTTHCVDKQLTEEQKTAIANGDLDFKNHRWHDKRLGPTIQDVLKEKGLSIAIGDRACCLDKNEGVYICIGIYENKNEQTMYCFHQIMTYGNRMNVGFLTIIHYAKFQEMFGEL